MANKNYEAGTFVVPKNGYKVSEQTAAIVDCIRMLDALYSRINKALDLIVGEDAAERRMDEKYYQAWNKIDDLLHEDLKTSIIYNLMELSNLQNDDEILV